MTKLRIEDLLDDDLETAHHRVRRLLEDPELKPSHVVKLFKILTRKTAKTRITPTVVREALMFRVLRAEEAARQRVVDGRGTDADNAYVMQRTEKWLRRNNWKPVDRGMA